MTFAELDRFFQSRRRVEQKKASFDYILADLIGRSVSRIYNSSNKMPPINEAYPKLFDNEEIKEKAQINKDEISAIRFKQFAQFHNKNFEEVAM